MALDSAVLFCTQSDMEYVLSVIGLQLAIDDDRSGTITATPDSTYLADCIAFASAEAVSYISRRYSVASMQQSDALREAVAVRASVRARRHMTNPLPESLSEWSDEVLEWYKNIREMKADLGLIPERSPARPGIINQRMDVRWPNPARLQPNQSTVPVGRRPFGSDYFDQAVAGI